MRTFFLVVILSLAGCSFLGDETRVLDGSYTDYNTYLNAELVPLPAFSARSLHFDETRYVLASEVDCRVLPVDSISMLKLLEIPSGVDVEAWIRYRNADFGNEYKEIEPEVHELLSGSARLTDVRVEEETRSYGEEEVDVQRVYYRLIGENLEFAGNLEVPSVQTQEHFCFVGDGFGGAR